MKKGHARLLRQIRAGATLEFFVGSGATLTTRDTTGGVVSVEPVALGVIIKLCTAGNLKVTEHKNRRSWYVYRITTDGLAALAKYDAHVAAAASFKRRP